MKKRRKTFETSNKSKPIDKKTVLIVGIKISSMVKIITISHNDICGNKTGVCSFFLIT